MALLSADIGYIASHHGIGADNRDEAISVLGSVTGAYALAWGGEVEVVGKTAEVAKAFVLKAWGAGIKPHLGDGAPEGTA